MALKLGHRGHRGHRGAPAPHFLAMLYQMTTTWIDIEVTKGFIFIKHVAFHTFKLEMPYMQLLEAPIMRWSKIWLIPFPYRDFRMLKS